MWCTPPDASHTDRADDKRPSRCHRYVVCCRCTKREPTTRSPCQGVCYVIYTRYMLIDNERRDTLRDALIRLCIEMRPLDGPPAVIRTDPAPGFRSLLNDELLHQHRLSLEIGRVKNLNKTPLQRKLFKSLRMSFVNSSHLVGQSRP